MRIKKLLLISAAIAVLIMLCHVCGLYKYTTLEGVKDYILSFGIWAPIIYIIMFTLVPLTLFPDSILAIAGGTVFGLFWGTVYTIIGAAFGATLSFYISRSFGRDVVERLIKHKAQWFEDGVEKRGFLLILVLRLIPLIPFDIISYGAGLSKIKYKDFIAATVLAIIPGVLVYTNVGDKALNINSWEFMYSILLLILLCVVSYLVKKRITFKDLQEKIIDNENTDINQKA